MGFWDLEHFGHSDTAADGFACVVSSIAETFKRLLRVQENEYNTCGIINVGMYFRDFIIQMPDDLQQRFYQDDFVEVAKETLMYLKKLKTICRKAKWADADEKRYHLKTYDDLINIVDNFIEASQQ